MLDYTVKGKEQHKLGLFACLSMALRFIWFNHRKAWSIEVALIVNGS